MYREVNNFIKVVMLLMLISVNVLANDNPPVKKSNSGICHPKGGTYYSRTKHYVSYQSMEACLKSGGRESKR